MTKLKIFEKLMTMLLFSEDLNKIVRFWRNGIIFHRFSHIL